MKEQRPDPEKLLRKVQQEEFKQKQGKLKIYLGAAPGVGKTYAMLSDARQDLKKGLDIVIGIVESHGREEVQNLIEGFEIIPRQEVNYYDKILLEFDIDAALKRNPGIVLLDEMAHTNAPQVRHKKRWHDIKELLSRGIDVYTTLNIQHIESLNDSVSQIINAPVKETVPDAMINMADTIELIDIPPEALLRRLQEGKVYVPQQAEIAAENFFRKGNLIALRELALRKTAEYVGTQVLLYRQDQGITQIWPTREKILVCVSPSPESHKLIREAYRIAHSLQVEWVAVYVNTSHLKQQDEKVAAALQNLRFAEQMGAETRVLVGFDIVEEIMNYAREQNVTQILVRKNIRSRLKELLFRNLADELVRASGEIDIHIMTSHDGVFKERKSTVEPKKILLKEYIFSVGAVSLATMINFFIFPMLATTNLVMVYLLGISLIALFGEIGPSVLASVLSVLAYDFFFVPPLYSFAISDIQYFFTLVIFLIVSQLIGNLTILTRRQMIASRGLEQQTSALLTLSRQLSKTRGIENLLRVSMEYLSDIFDSVMTPMLLDDGVFKSWLDHGVKRSLDEKERSVVQWVYDMGQIAGFGTDTLSYSDAFYLPLSASRGAIGVLKIIPQKKQLLTPEQMHFLESCAHQLALALEAEM